MPKHKMQWSLKVRFWVEGDGVKVLGPGRVELLGHIDRKRSISAAAKQMGMSYRRAWSLVTAMNESADAPLVELAAGGAGGGGATLTSRGKDAIALYRRIGARFARVAAELEAGSLG